MDYHTETISIILGDCLATMQSLPADCVDMVLTSPPYENARTYGIDFSLSGQAWVDWAADRYLECVRVSKGLVAWVVEGRTQDFQWSASPALLMAELHRRGVKLRKPPIYGRNGIPGSGGPDWLRNDYEFIVCSTKGKLPWSDNTAMGHPPVCKVGGAMSNRKSDGSRLQKVQTRRKSNGERARDGSYTQPELANPGNIVWLGAVGGGNIGSDLAHENEAPFAEDLAEFFIRSFCPPLGVILDPFCGSGTSLSVALQHGRRGIGIDIRQTQVDLTKKRIESLTSPT